MCITVRSKDVGTEMGYLFLPSPPPRANIPIAFFLKMSNNIHSQSNSTHTGQRRRFPELKYIYTKSFI